jgi:hypothetical protein
MPDMPLTPEAAEALAKLINVHEFAGRSLNTFADQFGSVQHECVAEWRDRIKAGMVTRRLPSRKSH